MSTATARKRLLSELDQEYGPQPIASPQAFPGEGIDTSALAQTPHAETNARHIVIVGTGRTARNLGVWLQTAVPTSVRFEGFLDDQPAPGVETVGRIQDLEHLARTRFIDEVVVCLPDNVAAARRAVFLARGLNLDIKVVPETYGCDLQYSSASMLGTIPLLTLRKRPAPTFNPLLKRALDMIASAGLLLLLAPALALISMLIKLTSPGPALYCAPAWAERVIRFGAANFALCERKQTWRKIRCEPRTNAQGRSSNLGMIHGSPHSGGFCVATASTNYRSCGMSCAGI